MNIKKCIEKNKPLYVSDGFNYTGKDSGCPYMTELLGKPSSCLTCEAVRCFAFFKSSERQRIYKGLCKRLSASP